MVRRLFSPLGFFAINIFLIALVTVLAPLERTLGANIRLVYFHGAWVWTGMMAFGAAALTGLAGLILRRWKKLPWAGRLPAWTLALGRVGLMIWITYLPMSLAVMWINWNGFFLDEPRFQVGLTFGIVGLLLQAGFFLLNQPDVVCAGSLVYGVALWVSLIKVNTVLHPASPIFTSDSLRIQIFFVALLVLLLLFGWQITRWLVRKIK